ncbi:hypothetical protein PACTADRAFT_50138 [Pachysolen tannophilus NRRL Y-2460]|uniref:Glycogen synthase kinase 1 n=1 Tax=Pachysolen tannophilus NRRL Y-2460 TaxID=669874 RepID=A0A1E4TUF6_PACTA|nr:hypothetical protein PACTADRAFT_50138 [Pachysolen tannophilus NRRL Y-2460]
MSSNIDSNIDKNDVEYDTEQVQDGHTGELKTITYTPCSIVGNGSFGMVFKTKLLHTNEDAAIKRVLQDKRFKNRELQIMKMLQHKNIVNLKYYFYHTSENDELYLNLILEYVPETLYKASQYYTHKKQNMPIFEIKLYSFQLLRALNYIHSLGICHRDIKPQNLLIDTDRGILKLCDFGSAKILVPTEPNVSYICSRYYRAPELIFGATNYSTNIDLWSAGCVIAELILGQPLFPGESGIDQLVEIIKILGTPTRHDIEVMNPNYMEHKFPIIRSIPLAKVFKHNCDLGLVALLEKILVYSPVDRLDAVHAMGAECFDELRNPKTEFVSRNKNVVVLGDSMIDFTDEELKNVQVPELISLLRGERERI